MAGFPGAWKKKGGREERGVGDCKQPKYRAIVGQELKVMRGEGVLPFQRCFGSELGLKRKN